MKEAALFPVDNFEEIKLKLLNWTKQFSSFCLLDNHQYHPVATGCNEPAFECLVAVGSKHRVVANAGQAFNELKQFSEQHPGEWLFGHFSYDLKNETEQLTSSLFDGIQFPDLHFFVPETIIKLTQQQIFIYTDEDAGILLNAIKTIAVGTSAHSPAHIQHRFSKEDYTSAVEKIRAHILRGDCYELNFCQEFFAENILIDPAVIYQQITAFSPVPFAAFYRMDDKYAICASPERYLKKTGTQIISQPIKGTSKRDLTNTGLDDIAKQSLLNSAKEKAENIMIVDLVRNDLSRICKEGSVHVKELFGIYSFPQVHQMISTVAGDIEKTLHWTEAIKATFPMGSMTGAPKKRVMELIETLEKTRRGLFSGSIGYVSPDGDFDFNVVIRSILYNAGTRYLSFQTGSAITFYSQAEKEYEECMLKAAAMMQVLGRIGQ